MDTNKLFGLALCVTLIGCNELFDIAPPIAGQGGAHPGEGGGGSDSSGGAGTTTSSQAQGGGGMGPSVGGGGSAPLPTCGNGTLDPGEACDPANPDGTQGPCSPECHFADIVSVTTGDAHSCALLVEKTEKKGFVKCWGDNTYGQIGTGVAGAVGDEPNEMGPALGAVDLGSDGNPIHVVAGGNHTCALLATPNETKLKCWGNNLYGQLGLGDTQQRGNIPGQMGDSLPYVDLGTGVSVVNVTLGQVHTCALLKGGGVKCWGRNDHGQAGQDTFSIDIGDEPNEMGDVLPVVTAEVEAIDAGDFHTCALYGIGEIRCWGYNKAGQLGIGSTSDQGFIDKIPPVQLAAMPKAVRAAGEQSCALLASGQVQCWGNNEKGALGLSEPGLLGDDFLEAGMLPTLKLPLSPIVAWGMGKEHTCGAFSSDGIRCWGSNANGQLGLGMSLVPDFLLSTPADANASDVFGGSADAVVIMLSSGGGHACALTSAAQVKCWGKNAGGQLGLGHDDDVGLQPGDMGASLPTVKISSVSH